MSSKLVELPLPVYGGPYQSGIIDPIWPAEGPPEIDRDLYQKHYAGQLDRQRHLHVVFADTTASSRKELAEVLKALSGFAKHQMKKRPPPLRPLDPPLGSQRVSVTIGFGPTLFSTLYGDDRFDLAGLRPKSLKIMPSFAGDEKFTPREQATDLVILIASDAVHINEYLFGRIQYGTVHSQIVTRRVERGYARPDNREPSGFEDGTTNPKNLSSGREIDHFVFVHKGDPEPDWCVGGTYLAYRKIQRRMDQFFKFNMAEREAIFGVDRRTGIRHRKVQNAAHTPKMNPRREAPDFTGTLDTARRFLRRPYFFNDGLAENGDDVRGIHHLSFVRDLMAQYEWPVVMWQTNPDFPEKGTGMDALYSRGGAANIGGGYYFLPAGFKSSRFIGDSLLR